MFLYSVLHSQNDFNPAKPPTLTEILRRLELEDVSEAQGSLSLSHAMRWVCLASAGRLL